MDYFKVLRPTPYDLHWPKSVDWSDAAFFQRRQMMAFQGPWTKDFVETLQHRGFVFIVKQRIVK